MRPLWIACVLSFAAFGQRAPLSFEAAEIKVNLSGPGDSNGDIANGRLFIRNVPLRFLIAEAWLITRDQVDGPAWLDDIRIDVLAKAESPVTPDRDIREMLRTLLKERMKLVTHMGEREKPVWALSVWKGQPKLKPSEMPTKPEDTSCSLKNNGTGTHYACEHITIATLVQKLPQVAQRDINLPVVDQTGLSEAWEITLDWMPEPRAQTEGGLSLFTALQAGLQLTAKKLNLPLLVVDSIERAPIDR